ncbi:T9SS type A sorting domain-containing protein [Chryseobacterium sp. IT-36CA2]|uniref:T9SS type A sorting domain-containing protein n=1 Tax=Chryseobacterium sp. IT-36CA2 TaxID=3026460 RepID=UPI0039DF2C8C
MKKTLTEIFRSSESFLREKKAGLIIVAVFCSTALSAQIIITDPGVPSVPTNNKVKITRQFVGANVPGFVPSSVSLEIKSGSTPETKVFTTTQTDPHTYTFPLLFSLPGYPPAVRTFKVYFPSPGLTSQYYPVPTAVGGSTTIIPGCWSPEMDRGLFYNIGPYNSYGYGVTLTRTASAEYLLQCTKFLCYECQPCPPLIPTSTKSNKTPQDKPKLYPNPSSGLSQFEYTASARETITVMVSDIAGRTVYGYKTDIESGVNKLPIDIQTSVSGTYYVNWSSTSGSSGSLQLIKK